MRVVYNKMISPGACDAAQLDCKIGGNEQTLGKSTSFDLDSGESDEVASSWLFLSRAQFLIGAEKVQPLAVEEGAHGTQRSMRLLSTQLGKSEAFPRRQLMELWRDERDGWLNDLLMQLR